ncbi:agamous-like MADS-box protein AGL104 isoform X2 [Olea europaea var. sylvestris]|uniref:agamous-like MADS-box protein AGL104 isoform X2 n=1 Tax=Olea europaea var. sylvestris TaxID=158386 RepID=UPI000C1D8077|nr:agamous-like MADS-box protein AGL104 isoform X2 [Olea europaea var. sylvestris]
MVRKKLAMKPIENSISLQTTFAKHKDVIVKKARELSVLCDTDVGLILFSPAGHLTSFASNGSVEDIFLCFVDRPHDLKGGHTRNEENLSRRLKHLKYERQILEKVANIEALEDKLDKLNQRHHGALEKMRWYEPNVEKINSILEAEVYEQFLTTAMQHIQQSKTNIEDAAFITDHSADMDQNRCSVGVEGHAGTCIPMGPHLSLSFIKSQKPWNAVGGELTPKLDGF